MLNYVNLVRTLNEPDKQPEILPLSSNEAIKRYQNSPIVLLEIIETKIKCPFG